jgi:hypothetical protein
MLSAEKVNHAQAPSTVQNVLSQGHPTQINIQNVPISQGHPTQISMVF